MSEWFVGLGYEGQLATWLVASFLLYTLASQLAWQFQWWFSAHPPVPGSDTDAGHGPDRSAHASVDAPTQHLAIDVPGEREDGLGQLNDRLRDHPLFPWVVEVMRLVYYLGIPFLAAINGLLRADVLGISGTDWIDGKSAQGFLWEDWAHGLGLATAGVLIVAGVWLVGRVASRRAGLTPAIQSTPDPLWRRLLDAFYDQIHWAFYRSGPILWLGDLYWGTFAGLALVLLEAGLNPALWWKLKSPETAGPPLIQLGIAWVSALLFIATQNLWLTLGVQMVLTGLLGTKEKSGYSPIGGSAR